MYRLVPTQPKGFTSWSSVLRRMFRRDVGHRSHSQEDGKIDVAPRGSARAHTRTHDWKSSCSDRVTAPRSFDLPVVEDEEERRQEEEEEERREKKKEKERRNKERSSTRIDQVSTIENTDAPVTTLSRTRENASTTTTTTTTTM